MDRVVLSNIIDMTKSKWANLEQTVRWGEICALASYFGSVLIRVVNSREINFL